MKHLIFVVFVLLFAATTTVSAQSSTELRPFWAYSTPVPPAGANYFLSWGVGEGHDEQSATNAAWVDALQKSLHELGVVGITRQDINTVATQGIHAVVKFNQMKRRIVSATEPIALSGNRMKIYILIQVQRNVNGVDDFYSLNTGSFRDKNFNKRLKDYKASITGRYPFSGRVFIPGWAQLHKGSKGKGIFFILAEAACVGGIVATENMRASYESKYGSTHDADKKRSYANKADNCANLRNGLIAGAAAVYLWNVIDGIAARGKRKPFMLGDAQLEVSPYVAPQAGGFALSLNF
ncbi:hypothetical protein [uncultured Bacteroides sp.]|uniref:hypothetical protein n=1 Tax=uncultured Bacteroides sp. TaxID=162156 RepID=UPI00260E325A|nr:hypothetical protein [uncultured Bacteroides sp.]